MVGTPSEKEEEYIKRQELERIKNLREQAAKETAEQEKVKLKELHWMRCPKCGLELEEITYRGIKIDECFSCGGVFLDAGELQAVAASEGSGGVLAGLSRILGRKS